MVGNCERSKAIQGFKFGSVSAFMFTFQINPEFAGHVLIDSD